MSALCDRTVPVLGLLSCRWSETRTCWFPHPDEQPVKSSLRLLILTRLCRRRVWVCQCCFGSALQRKCSSAACHSHASLQHTFNSSRGRPLRVSATLEPHNRPSRRAVMQWPPSRSSSGREAQERGAVVGHRLRGVAAREAPHARLRPDVEHGHRAV